MRMGPGSEAYKWLKKKKKITVLHSPAVPGKGFSKQGNLHTPSLCGLPVSKILTGKITKELKKKKVHT